jgi:type IV pilus assembly protein PilX
MKMDGIPQRQRGVVLVIALILLVVLSLTALYTMRGAILGEKVSKNIRSNEVAAQAAEIALRYCENQIRTGGSITINELPVTIAAGAMPIQWQKRTNWTNAAGLSVEVPASEMVASGMRPMPILPRCMIERFILPPAAGEDVKAVVFMQPHLITAVGYSPDYSTNASNQAISGGEVWLQSMLIP